MPTDKLKECWNCGYSYNPNNTEICPDCHSHPDDEQLAYNPDDDIQEDE